MVAHAFVAHAFGLPARAAGQQRHRSAKWQAHSRRRCREIAAQTRETRNQQLNTSLPLPRRLLGPEATVPHFAIPTQYPHPVPLAPNIHPYLQATHRLTQARERQ